MAAEYRTLLAPVYAGEHSPATVILDSKVRDHQLLRSAAPSRRRPPAPHYCNLQFARGATERVSFASESSPYYVLKMYMFFDPGLSCGHRTRLVPSRLSVIH